MLKGKTAFITGASRGIGKAIALKFAENNANLVLNATKLENLKSTEDEIKKYNIDYLILEGDISKEQDVKSMANQAFEKFGSIDILVNNAGITKDNLIFRIKEEDWDRVLNINLKGAFFMCKVLARKMIKNKFGKIINITSVVGQMGNQGQANYVSSKAGLIGLTKALAREFASRNINVNAIAPGFIESEMTSNAESKILDEIKNSIPLGRIGIAENIADAALFLASSMSDYITGHILSVNGGLYM
jgi:3-oxoacyl-[acyl-carrier protein] reductase